MRVHPAAEIVPLMTGPAYDAFLADIRANGLEKPLVLHPDGRLIDGRNRLRACRQAGIEPRFITYEGDPSDTGVRAFVMTVNVFRRHLKKSQRAMIAGRRSEQLIPEGLERRNEALQRGRRRQRSRVTLNSGKPAETAKERRARYKAQRSTARAAAELNVSEDSTTHALFVLKRAVPEIVAAVDAGDLSVNRAHGLARLPADEQRAAIAGGRDALKTAARLAKIRAKEERMTAKDGGRKGRRRRPPAPPIQVVAGGLSDERFGRQAKSAKLVEIFERIDRFPWTPAEAAEQFDEGMTQALLRYWEPAERWLGEFRRRWEATRGGSVAQRRAGGEP